MTFRSVIVHKGKGGWGGPLVLAPNKKKKYVISVTGGGVHPVARKIAELTGTTAVDAFKNPVERDETLAAVIDCGGTARCGTYPKMGIPTINIKLQEPSGPLSKFMTEDIFVSGTTSNDIELAKDDEIQAPISVSESSDNDEIVENTDDEEQTVIENGRL